MDIVLGNYKGLKANIPYIAYTEEDVNSQIATLLSGNPVREQKTGPLAMGDTAVIDYEGFKDGVAFEGGKAEKYPLGIGSGSFIPGFEEQLVGMEIGEDRDINLSFPEQYHAPELAGKAVVFKVKLHEIYNEKEAKLVRRHLEKWDYDVHVVQKFDAVMSEFASFDPQLVLMDIGLPFYNGYHWCTEIRRVSKVPVVFLSSAADNMNIVMAVSMGADDFIAKPFDLDVLTVKIQAIIRRCYDFGANNSVLEHNGAMLNISDATITYDDKRLELTKNELKILQTLFDNKERIVSRSLLMEKLWESDAYVDENTLSVNVNRLRKKLDSIGLESFIVTKKGLGYRLG